MQNMYTYIYTYAELPSARWADCLFRQNRPGMRVTLWKAWRQGGLSGQTPSRGSLCPGRPSACPRSASLVDPERFFRIPDLGMFREGRWVSCWSPRAKSGCVSKLTRQPQPGDVVTWSPRQQKAVSVALRAIENSQMPRHLISDAHEWINEIPTVPIYYLAKPLPRERAWKN